ncbi:MAG: Arc family DNA-binding protein [Rubrivivax sp.]|nr:Arc family DNA-binding protein [Rubrivivax sp.]
MSTIVVKNFPEDLHDRLKERAERNRRSMNKEVVHLLAAGLGSESSQPALPGPLRGRLVGSEVIEAAIADRAIEPNKAPDGREALRAALIKQPDGTFVNVLGIDDSAFFDTLQRIRAEARVPDVKRLFDAKP